MTDDTEARLKLIEETLEDPDDFMIRELRWAVGEIRRLKDQSELAEYALHKALKAVQQERDGLKLELSRIGRERDLLLLIVRSATQLIENEANFTAQSYACVNNLRNLIADWKGHG